MGYSLLMIEILMNCIFKVTVDLRGVFWGKQYSALCINGKYINLYIHRGTSMKSDFCVHLDMSQIGIVCFTKRGLGILKF